MDSLVSKIEALWKMCNAVTFSTKSNAYSIPFPKSFISVFQPQNGKLGEKCLFMGHLIAYLYGAVVVSTVGLVVDTVELVLEHVTAVGHQIVKPSAK